MIRLIKIGGSLLERHDFAKVIPQWIASQHPATNWILIGGGEAVEAMRHIDRRFELNRCDMHWRCVRMLTATAEIASELLRPWPLVSHPPDLQRSSATPQVIDVPQFYSADQHTPLPEDWRTTTDAIAAWLAVRLQCDELVLLKSCSVPKGVELAALAGKGIVDEAIEPYWRSHGMEIGLRIESIDS
jgi:5-(aminomethyl)-3-furanmethanol phosphate kinase